MYAWRMNARVGARTQALVDALARVTGQSRSACIRVILWAALGCIGAPPDGAAVIGAALTRMWGYAADEAPAEEEAE